MGTTVDNPNSGAVAQGGNTPSAGAQQPTLQQLAQALILRLLAMPPDPGAPSGSTEYVLSADINLKTLTRPTKSQMTHGGAVLAELVTFAATHDWTSTFGVVSPTAEQTQQVFRTALAWSKEDSAAKEWSVQTGGNSKVAWDEVLTVTAALKPVLDRLIVSNPDLTRTMPATIAFLEERATAAKKGVTTRKAPETAKAKTTKHQAQAAKSEKESEALAASNAILHPPPAPAPAPTAPASGNGTRTP